MPLDPYIARGVEPINLTNTLGQIGLLKQRDRALAADETQNAFIRQRYDDQQQKAQLDDQKKSQLQGLYWRAKMGDQSAVMEAVQGIAGHDPRMAQLVQSNPKQAADTAMQMMESVLGITPQKTPGAITTQQFPGVGAGLVQDGKLIPGAFRETPQPREYAPREQYQSLSPDEVRALGLPEGTVAQRSSDGKLDVVNKPPAQALTPKDASAAQTKLRQLAIARKQLALVREKFAALKDTYSSGPGGNYVPTEKGKAADAAVNSMRDTLTSLTRVPGIGAMSDFETRLAQAKFPDRGQYESVSAQQIQSIEDLLIGLETGYRDMLGGGSAAPESPAQSAPAQPKAAPKPGDNVRGFIFIGGEPADRKNWVKAR